MFCSVTHFRSEERVDATVDLVFPSSSVCTWTTLACWRAKFITVWFLTCSPLAVCRRPWASCVFAGSDSHFWSARSLFTYRMISLRLVISKSACRLLCLPHCLWHPPLVDFYPCQGCLVPQMWSLSSRHSNFLEMSASFSLHRKIYELCAVSGRKSKMFRLLFFSLWLVVASREAARECRRKKKEYVKCLENRVAVLENQNKTLIEELRALKDIYRHKAEWSLCLEEELRLCVCGLCRCTSVRVSWGLLRFCFCWHMLANARKHTLAQNTPCPCC